MMNHTSPIIEHQDDDTLEESFQANGYCWCFSPTLFFGWNRANEGETKGLLGGDRETWLGESLRKAKEASELLAGPKWKNFIRKISRQRKMRKGQFQYDLQSYALNFNDGVGVDDEDDGMLAGFSARFVGPASGGERGSSL